MFLCEELIYDRCGVVLMFLCWIFIMVLSVFCCVVLFVLNVIEIKCGLSGESCVCVLCSFLVFFVVLGGKNLKLN